MENDQNNQENPIGQVVPETPQLPQAQYSSPSSSEAPANQVTPTPPPAITQPATTQSRGHNGVIIAVIAIVTTTLIAIVGGLLAWFILLSPGAQASRSSNEFMKAASSGDVQKIYAITEAESDSDKKFLDGVVASLKGSYSLTDKTSQNNKWYFLYELKGADSTHARTVVEKKDSKYVVTSIVHGKSPLKLIPSERVSLEAEPEPKEEPTTKSVACLAQADYRWMNYNKQPSSVQYDSTLGENTFNYTATMFFEANTTKERSLPSIYDDWAEFATKNTDKQWKFILKGQINQQGQNSVDTSPEVQLANNRAEKVKSELTSRNVPLSRITIVNPTDTSKKFLKGTPQEVRSGTVFQSVILTIDPTCS